MSGDWYCRGSCGELGPMSPQELRTLVISGRLRATDEVRKGANGHWVSAQQMVSTLKPSSLSAEASTSGAQPARSLNVPAPPPVSQPSAGSRSATWLLAAGVLMAVGTVAFWFGSRRGGGEMPVASAPRARVEEDIAPSRSEKEVEATEEPAARTESPQTTTNDTEKTASSVPAGRETKETVTSAETKPAVTSTPTVPSAVVEVPMPAAPAAPPVSTPPSTAPASPPVPASAPPASPPPANVAPMPAPPMPVAAPLGGDAQEDESIRRRQAEFQRLLTVRAGLLTEHNQASKEAQDIETALTATGIALATVQKQIATEQASLAALDKAIANLNAQYNTVNNAATRSLLEAQIISSQTQYRTQTANLEKIQQKAAMYENDIKTFTTKQAEAKKRLDGLSDKGYRVWKDWLALVDPLDRYTRREHEAAIPFFTATIQADARNGGALLARGVAYMRIGKTQEALDDLDAAIRLGEPYLEQALPIRGRLLVSLDRERDGMLDFAQAVKLHKANGMLYVHRGLVYWAQAKYPLAEKDFREASRLGDAEADSLRLLALRYAASPDPLVKDGKKALEFAKRACTLTNDQDWRALVALAAAQAEGGDFEGAMKTVDRALPLAVGDNRKLCQEHRELYASGKPLRTMP